MLRTYLLSIPLTITMTGLLSSAAAAALDPAYLAGVWAINSKESCEDRNAEYLILNGDSSFEYSRRGKADAAGFWRIDDDVMVLDMMTSPAFFQDIHAELQASNEYQVYSMRAMPIDMEQGHFSVVVSIGDKMQRFSLERCQ
jgi:hypothetical protein